MHNATHLLATDLDGTLVGDEDGLRSLLSYFDTLDYEVHLAYVTGRHLQSALDLMEEQQLPAPDLLITDIGTSIYYGHTLTLDREWQGLMENHWKPEEIKVIARSCPEVTPQILPDERRLSYFVNSDLPAQLFKKKLDFGQIPHKFIYSAARYIDVLPADAGKGNALLYALKKYFPSNINVLTAGDSGNDLEMLTVDFPAVIVGNAHDELAAIRDCQNIYRASKSCAGGIQEAWEHFFGNPAKEDDRKKKVAMQ